MANAAIFYAPEGYDTSGHKLMGRHAAGEGFLKGFCRHSESKEVVCFVQNADHFNDFLKKFGQYIPEGKKAGYVQVGDPTALNKVGNVFYPSPGIDALSWIRRRFGQRLYGLTGITHTTASDRVMDGIGALLTAPVQPWDAVICTSSVVKKTFERIFETYGEYLKQKFGLPTIPNTSVMLPVIPLGVDVSQFSSGDTKQQQRKSWREKLGIADGDIAVLYMGRLSFHAKAHPFPMYMALENAARITGKKIHLIQAGWFYNQHIENSFKVAAQQVCPSVNAIFLDGRLKDVREGIWSAGDIFCSLSDNIQETFGLTPIEAMAAGLPQVISDWDGYKDTVRDGVDGFRVKTITANPGSGEWLSFRYESEIDNYDIYCANAGLAASVDIGGTAKAFVELINNPDLRIKMGDTGRKRAEETYDWKHVVRSYEELWAEQDARRNSSAEESARTISAPANPMREDPLKLFESYPSEFISDNTKLRIMLKDPVKAVARLRSLAIANYGAAFREDVVKQIIELVTKTPSITVNEVSAGIPMVAKDILELNIMWLLKFGVLEITS